MSTFQLPKTSGISTPFSNTNAEQIATKEMNPPASHNFNEWDLDKLSDYIITTHHTYVKKNTVVIYELMQELGNTHRQNHPELLKLSEVAFLFFHDLLNHLKKEERILFPNIN